MNEYEEVVQASLQALESGETTALTTVVQVRGSAPRHAGARMLVWPDGRILGTVGGATLEEKVIQHAQEAIAANRSRLEKYIFSTDNSPESVGLCGGEVLVSIEVLQPPPTLVVIGAGHIAVALAEMAHVMGWRLTLVDDRKEFLAADRFPPGARLKHVQYDPDTESLASLPVKLTPSMFVIVATWGWDEPVLAQILTSENLPAYVGLIASKTKWRVIRERLLARDVPAECVDQVHAPSGLNLGAETPGEIALSILAELLMMHRKVAEVPSIIQPARS